MPFSLSEQLNRIFSSCPHCLHFFPFMRWRERITGENLKSDSLAGLTGALIVLPQAVAFATIAGLPPEYGLYAAMIPTIIAALFGSSWHLVSGPTTAISVVVYAAVSPLADPGTPDFISLVLTLTFLTGVFQLLMGIAKMGKFVNFISHTVIIGFTAGAALLIFSSQIKNFFGLDLPRGVSVFETFRQLGLHVTDINFFVTSVATFSLMIGLYARRYIKRIPYMVISMIAGGLIAAPLNMIWGEDLTGIKTVGSLAAHFPPLSLPNFSLDSLHAVFFPALAVTVLALTEAVSISRSIAAKSGQHINGNQEFIGQGLSNILGSFFSSYASSGSFNRSGVNFEAGAKTPLAAVFSSIFLFLILLVVAPLAAYIPVPALAAVLFMVAWSLVDFHHFGIILKAKSKETAILVVSFLGTVIDLEKGIFVGILLSLTFYLLQASRPWVRSLVPMTEEDGDRTFIPCISHETECPQFKIIRIEGDLFFGSIDHVRQSFLLFREKMAGQKHLILFLDKVNLLDMSGVSLLAEENEIRQNLGGGVYIVAGNKDEIVHILRNFDLEKKLPAENIFLHKSQAIAKVLASRKEDICKDCTLRLFHECPT